MHWHVHKRAHAYIRTYIHTYIHTYVRTYVRTYIRMCVYAQLQIHTHVHVSMCTHIPVWVCIVVYYSLAFLSAIISPGQFVPLSIGAAVQDARRTWRRRLARASTLFLSEQEVLLLPTIGNSLQKQKACTKY